MVAGCIDLEDGICGPIDISVNAQTEQVLMVMGVHAGVDLCAPAVGVFAGVHGVRVQNAGELDVKLDGAVLVEDPVDAVFIVRGCEDLGDDKFPAAGDDRRVVAEISVLEQYPSVFLMNADGVFDNCASAGTVDESRIHVVDCTFAVAAEGQAVGHVAATVFAQVESVLALMRVLGVAIWNHHLGQGQPVEDVANVALVVVRDVVEHNAFAVVEANVDIPILPTDRSSVDVERDTLWLSNMNWLQVRPIPAFLFD